MREGENGPWVGPEGSHWCPVEGHITWPTSLKTQWLRRASDSFPILCSGSQADRGQNPSPCLPGKDLPQTEGKHWEQYHSFPLEFQASKHGSCFSLYFGLLSTVPTRDSTSCSPKTTPVAARRVLLKWRWQKGLAFTQHSLCAF